MAKLLDAILPGIAKQLLDQFGTLATLRLIEPATYDPVAMETVLTSTDVEINVVMQAVTPGSPQITESGDGVTAIEAVAREVIFSPLAPLPRAPRLGDRFLIGGMENEILALDPIFSGDAVAVYRAFVGR